MDILFGQSWKTSVLALAAGIFLYFEQAGVTFPSTSKEWGTAIVSAIIFAWGRLQKDQDKSNSPTPTVASTTVPKS